MLAPHPTTTPAAPMRRIPFVQRLAVSGVGVSVLILIGMALLWALSAALWSTLPKAAEAIGLLLVLPGSYVLFAIAHLLVFCGLLGGVLWITRQSSDPKLTLISAVVGLLLGMPVLSRIYLNVPVF